MRLYSILSHFVRCIGLLAQAWPRSKIGCINHGIKMCLKIVGSSINPFVNGVPTLNVSAFKFVAITQVLVFVPLIVQAEAFRLPQKWPNGIHRSSNIFQGLIVNAYCASSADCDFSIDTGKSFQEIVNSHLATIPPSVSQTSNESKYSRDERAENNVNWIGWGQFIAGVVIVFVGAFGFMFLWFIFESRVLCGGPSPTIAEGDARYWAKRKLRNSEAVSSSAGLGLDVATLTTQASEAKRGPSERSEDAAECRRDDSKNAGATCTCDAQKMAGATVCWWCGDKIK
jgi:hypothetical protein